MDPFIGEIRVFSGTYAPLGWAFCNGQLIPISQNTTLFAILGTTYGGDGKTTFALPNLQGRVPLHAGNGPGLSQRILGQMGGENAVTLIEANLPNHLHSVNVAGSGTQASPEGAVWASGGRGQAETYTSPNSNLVPMSPAAISPSGGSTPHENKQPFLTVNFIIALEGIFPQRP
ncbi:phage tail protein [Bacillus horti]|uniref:Microcystin-dependent protein n=1 Tax=Caldalkalibacillus horti TaxID=77523 RepID=A0ABT9VVL3_9BACI|nr:tail fiber protein [Bacillus horti]MDQ0165037.1 microcystin-dependent protein [Bacillus horti]